MPLMPKKISRVSLVIFFIAFVALDQIIKMAIINAGAEVSYNRGLPVFSEYVVVNVVYVAVVVLLISLIALGRKFFKLNEPLGILMVLAGAISNLFDRIFRGGVVDYIDLKIWPTFNFADVLIVTGCFLLIWAILSRPCRT